MVHVLEISGSGLGVKTIAESRVVMFVFEHPLYGFEARIERACPLTVRKILQ